MVIFGVFQKFVNLLKKFWGCFKEIGHQQKLMNTPNKNISLKGFEPQVKNLGLGNFYS